MTQLPSSGTFGALGSFSQDGSVDVVSVLFSTHAAYLEHLAGPRHPERPDATGRIPTLDALLAALPPDMPVNIELKAGRVDRGRLAELALAVTSGRENVLFSSFDAEVLRELRRRRATALLAPLAKRWTPGLERLGEELAAWSLHVAQGIARARASRAAGGGGAGAA